ncbi:hypothetical protein HII31_07534 [Pseudocercospora fuligena]|uniref:Extracellular serine-rich protein n=1 Tax=Pseudocercospora fuligena TaxID=685502 RepID=A0A8H6VKB0_9PEZI|nr:hypothetical protein HII31_07534 [Pseudocercospora fuligena]
MLGLKKSVAIATIFLISASGQRTTSTSTRTTSIRPTTRSTSLTSTNTVYTCGCTAPTQVATSTLPASVTRVTLTISSTPFACGCTSSKLVSTSRSTSTKTTSTSTRSTITSSLTTSTRSATASSTISTSTSSTPVLPTTSSQTSTSSSTVTSRQTTSAGFNSTIPATNGTNSTVSAGRTVRNTILVLAKNANDAYNAYSGLNGYGIPYEVLIVPSTGTTLPTLNSTSTSGNYGGFIIVSELSYQTSSGGWASGLTDDQFTQIYNYQKSFGVRMTRLDTYPWSAFGAKALGTGGGCCESGDQLVYFTNTTGFQTANIKSGSSASMSTKAIWHYPSVVTDPTTTWEIAAYDPDSSGYVSNKTTAAVINDFNGRQQMVFFMGWATEWSATSTYLQHTYIHWMTRGLFIGARKTHLLNQIDDVHLRSAMYSPSGKFYRTIPADYQAHADWQVNLNSRLPPGSSFFLELGHNGNGDIIAATNGTVDGPTLCSPNTAIYYSAPADTTLEFQKPLGSGTSVWPTSPSNYTYSLACARIDDLARWFNDPINRENFAHVSHTFTHLHENNATYNDIFKEIYFNQLWLSQIGILDSPKFSPNGLIPPAITGLHNGDAIRAWSDNGIKYVVGDNSRPVLLSTASDFYPLISTLSSNGFDGEVIIPRWPTKIYYDCDLPACTTQEWTDLFGGTGSFTDLLAAEKSTTSRYLLALRHDPYMFHQANLRVNDVDPYTVGSQTGKMSLVMIWTETVLQEMMRLTNWPIITLKHDDIAKDFVNRIARDQCSPNLQWLYSSDGASIIGVTVGAGNGTNSCSVEIPVTFPGSASGGNARDDQVGSEPLIKWVTFSGQAQTFMLGSPISVLA